MSKLYRSSGVEVNHKFKPGDTYDISYQFAIGHLTASQTEVQFAIILPKKVDDSVSDITLSDGNLTVRHADGGYLANGLISTFGSADILSISCNQVIIKVTLSETSSYTNNSVVNVLIRNFTLTFS